MKKTIKPALFFLLIFVISLLILAPARLVYYALPENGTAQLSGVSGTIWNGKASQLIWQNQNIGNLEWKLKLRHLFSARIGGNFNLSGSDMKISGSGSTNRKQHIIIKDTHATFNAATLPLPPTAAIVTPAGRIEADIKQLSLNGNIIESTATIIHWDNASITQPMAVSLGDILLDINGKDGDLKGLLSSSKDSPIDLSGNIDINAAGTLKTNIKITPKNNTPDDILDLLPMLGRPDSKGAVSFKYSGKVTL